MRVDISKSNVQSNFGKVHWIEAKNRIFYFGTDAGWTRHSAVNMRDARIKFEIDPGDLSRAVLREGYVIDGLEINRYRPTNSDSNGIVTEDGLFEADLELVRDWQVRDPDGEPWTEWDRDSQCWGYWRPASWAEPEVGVEEPRPTPFSEEERSAVLLKIQSGALPPETSGIDLHLWTVTEALNLNYNQAKKDLAKKDPKICALHVLAKSLRFGQDFSMSAGASETQKDPVYARLAKIAGVPYDEAVTLASCPTWQETFASLVQDQASVVALKKYGIEIDWPSSKYHDLARDLADLVVEKQRQYGDSAGRSGKILAVLYPDGIPVEKYDSALLVVRVLDKLSRIATHETDAGGEEPWRDIAGYALLALAGKR